jgi:spermidine/putrescine transport system permease protein
MRILRAYSWALLLFLWSPLLIVLWKGLNVTAFQRLLESSDLLMSFRSSLLLAIGTALISAVLGLTTAFALPLLSPRLRTWVVGSLLLPLVLPEIAFGLAYLVWYRSLGIPLGWTTLLVSHFAFCFCYVVLVLKSNVEQLDASLADAAKDLGANGFMVFRHAFFPQLLPGIIAGTMMAFSLSLDDFLITFFVKGIDQLTLPIKIFSMMRLRFGTEVYALSVVLFGISVISVVITQLWFIRSQKSRR